MVNHLMRHASVHRKADSVYKIIFRLAEEYGSTGNVFGSTDALRRMLQQIGRSIFRSFTTLFGVLRLGFDPARRYGIDPGYASQTDGQGMSQRCDASFGGRIAFGVGL